VGKSPSRFDFKKLENLNGHYIREADNARLADLIAPKLGLSDDQKQLLVRAMPELKPRANTLHQLADGAHFLFMERPLEVDEAAAALLTSDARSMLHVAHDKLSALADWDVPSLEAAIREVAEGSGVKLGKLAQPLRAALTGRTTSPGIFDVLALLGRDESLDRIADQMEPKE
jgi:glutamyl-tRNA synthetase